MYTVRDGEWVPSKTGTLASLSERVRIAHSGKRGIVSAAVKCFVNVNSQNGSHPHLAMVEIHFYKRAYDGIETKMDFEMGHIVCERVAYFSAAAYLGTKQT